MIPSHSTLAAVLDSAPAWIWKRSVHVSETGPHRTATKIGNALFPGWLLRISHLVTLRPSKAPITVCASALRRCLPPGKRLLFWLRASGTIASVRTPLGSEMSFLRHARLRNKWSHLFHLGRFYPPQMGRRFISSSSFQLSLGGLLSSRARLCFTGPENLAHLGL